MEVFTWYSIISPQMPLLLAPEILDAVDLVSAYHYSCVLMRDMIPCVGMERNRMTGGASVEETLSLTVEGLRSVKEKIRPLFGQDRVAVSAEHAPGQSAAQDGLATCGSCRRRRPLASAGFAGPDAVGR